MEVKREHPLDELDRLVNGTLAPEEQEKVERHLAHCERCRAELRFLRALKRGLEEEWKGQQPGELAWARLRAAVRAEKGGSTTRKRFWERLAVAAAIVMVVQFGVIGYLVHSPVKEDVRYAPLGMQEEGNGADLLVRFQPEATEGRIRKLLQEGGMELVGGPGALGIYRLKVEDPGPEGVRKAQRLLQQSGLVEEVRAP